MNKEEFNSAALKVNLAETRQDSIPIPAEHQKILKLSSDYWGIHKRSREFFAELNHPYANHRVVADEYRNILLGDRWLYEQADSRGEVLISLLDIASSLLEKPVDDEVAGQLLRTCLEFFGQCDPQNDSRNAPLLDYLCGLLGKLLEKRPALLAANSDLLKKHLSAMAGNEDFAGKLTPLVKRVLAHSQKIWKESSRAEEWFAKQAHLFENDYSEAIREIGCPFFDAQQQELAAASSWDDLCSGRVLFFNETAARFREFGKTFEKQIEHFYYLLFLLHLPGMAHYRKTLLWELNGVIRDIGSEVGDDEFIRFLDNIFELFAEQKDAYMSTVLECIFTLGKEVITVADRPTVSLFENKLIELGFVGPGKVFIQDNWQLKVDPNHVENIRVWLQLIMHAPYTFRKLLSALIVNLRLGGIFIFDTDLFQRDISSLLNSDISPMYKQIKQLTRIFPVYFNEIGAEGELREVTTVLDELSGRQDRLIHFLRKQVHIEGNNAHIDLTANIFRYWCDGNKEHLDGLLPEEIYSGLEHSGPWVTGVNRLLSDICARHHCSANDLLGLNRETFEAWTAGSDAGSSDDKRRLGLLFKLYVLLREKYSFDISDITELLSRYRFFSKSQVGALKEHLDRGETEKGLELIFDMIDQLNQVIFDPAFSEGWESIYHKRHIAFGIPSMYGQYREDKFEALGLIFRLERLATLLMEEKIHAHHTEYITARSLKMSYRILSLLRRGLELDGISSQGLDANLQMLRYGLTSESFSLGQFINLFQFMSDNVKEITNTYFFSFYDQPLKVIIPQIFDPGGRLDEKEKKQLIVRHSEAFYREILYSSFLIQPFDNYLSHMIHALQNMVDNFSSDLIRNIMSYDPDLAISPLYEETPKTDNQIFLGAKAYFQKKLYLKGFPVPPGVVLTTEVFRRRKALLASPDLEREVDALLREHIGRLEKMSGRSFGCPRRPLLLSVRSGTATSMPGAMNTFLNVGMNDRIVESMSRKKDFGWTSWDCYRRLLQSWGMANGISRDVFDQVMIDFKERYRVEQKVEFSPARMREMAFAYKDILKDAKIRFEENPWEQLKKAIGHVFDSWDSERANVYRSYLQIADEWGTAVIIQQMVLGNIGERSGTGVVFTHNPQVKKPGIYLHGDFTLCSQGEDIVAGLVHALPVSRLQKQLSQRDNQDSMEEILPEIYEKLLGIAVELVEGHGYNHQEIEFTFESEKPSELYILQIRDQDTRKTEQLKVFTSSLDEMQLLGRGIGGSGGALNGRVAIDMDDILNIRERNPGDPCILLRPDTAPDDIPIIFECDGLVAARGGTTSHAAVTAARLGKVCVLNCRQLVVDEGKKLCTINGVILKPGDKVAIDGFSGNFFRGHYATEATEISR